MVGRSGSGGISNERCSVRMNAESVIAMGWGLCVASWHCRETRVCVRCVVCVSDPSLYTLTHSAPPPSKHSL